MPDRKTERWHVGKEIPITVIVAFIAQSILWIWFTADKSATQTAKLDNLTLMVAEFKAAQYTQMDAKRDMELSMQRHMENRRRIEALERRVGP